MRTPSAHPSWCARREGRGEPHQSHAVQANTPQSTFRVRILQFPGTPDPIVSIEQVCRSGATSLQLDQDQAAALAAALRPILAKLEAAR